MNSKSMTELVAEHRDSLAALTQRIGEQNGLLNLQDAERVNDEHLLRQALSQIVALNEELDRAHGHEPLPNVVALMIEERLKNLPAAVAPVFEWEDITDPEHILTAEDEGSAVSNPPESGWVPCAELTGVVGNPVKDFKSLRYRRRKPIPPVATVPAVDTDKYPSPFRMPFTDPRSGMGIRKNGRCPKCGKDLDFDGDCEFCDGFVTHRPPQERKDDIEHSACYYDTDRNK